MFKFCFYAVLAFLFLNIAVAFNISVPSTLVIGRPAELNWTWNQGDEEPIGYVLCDAGPGSERPGCDIFSRPRAIRNLEAGRGKINVTAPSIGMFFVSAFTSSDGSDPEDGDFRRMFPIFESSVIEAVGPNGEGNATSVSIASSDLPTSTVPSSTVSSLSRTSFTTMGTPTSGVESNTDSKKTRIIGGVVGGVSALFLGLCILLCATLTRRRRAKSSLLSSNYTPTDSSSGTRSFRSRGLVQPQPYNFEPQYSWSPVDDGSPQTDRPELRIIPPAKLAEMRALARSNKPGSRGHGSPLSQENISPPQASPVRSNRSLPVPPREDSDVVVRHEDSGWRQLPLPAPSRRVVEVPPSYVSD